MFISINIRRYGRVTCLNHCIIYTFLFTITQERGKALSLVEDQPDSGTAAPVDSKVTVKGQDYNELVVTVDKCRGLMTSTSGMLILSTMRERVCAVHV